MSSLILPRRFYNQPQGAVSLNSSNPITPDYVWSAGSGVFCGINGHRLGVEGPSSSYVAIQEGVGYVGSRVANGGLDIGLFQPIYGPVFTALVWAMPKSTDDVSVLFSQRDGSSPYNQIDLMVNSDSSLVNKAGAIANTVIGPTGSNSSKSNGSVYCNGGVHQYGVINTGYNSTPSIIFDGAAVSATTVSNTLTSNPATSTQRTRIGNIGDYSVNGNYVAQSPIIMVAIWNKVLSAIEVRNTYQNPWQLLRASE